MGTSRDKKRSVLKCLFKKLPKAGSGSEIKRKVRSGTKEYVDSTTLLPEEEIVERNISTKIFFPVKKKSFC
jgi:hypothetical protein